MNATAKIIPGIAYPDIENVVKISKKLTFCYSVSIICNKRKNNH